MQRSTLLILVALTVVPLAGCLAPAAPPESLDPGAALGPGTVGGSAEVPDVAAAGAEVVKHADAVELVWTGEVGFTIPLGPLTSAISPIVEYEFEVPAAVTILDADLDWESEQVALGLAVRDQDGRTQCRSVGGTEDDASRRQCRAWHVAERAEAATWTVRVTPQQHPGGLLAPEPYTLRLNLSVRPFQLLGPALGQEQRSAALGFFTTRVSEEYMSAEPSIKLDGSDTVYIAIPVGTLEPLFRSRDGGATWEVVDINANSDAAGQLWAMGGPGGGDSEVFVTPDGNELYYADLWGGCLTVAGSGDAGESWHVNPLSCEVPISDRQWLWAQPGGHLWMNYNGMPSGPLGPAGLRGRHTVMHSLDGGVTWPFRATIPEDACARGNLVVDADGRVFAAGCNADGPGVAVSEPGPLMAFTWHTVAQRSGEAPDGFCFVCAIFTVIDIDTAGNLYVVWSDPSEGGTYDIWLSTSQDQGSTWSEPVRVNRAEGTAVLPWVAAGEPGHAVVAWYQTADPSVPSAVQGEWYVHLAETTTALDAAPSFGEALVQEEPVQFGPICIVGSACTASRNLLDFLMVDIDSAGAAHVAYVDGGHGGSPANSFLLYARQTAGLALDAGAGPAAAEPAPEPRASGQGPRARGSA